MPKFNFACSVQGVANIHIVGTHGSCVLFAKRWPLVGYLGRTARASLQFVDMCHMDKKMAAAWGCGHLGIGYAGDLFHEGFGGFAVLDADYEAAGVLDADALKVVVGGGSGGVIDYGGPDSGCEVEIELEEAG